MVSLPAKPFKVSLPLAPVRMSLPDVPVRILFAATPTARLKVVLAAAPAKSVAVTFNDKLPILADPGVPCNVPVVALKLSQLGNVLPLDCTTK